MSARNEREAHAMFVHTQPMQRRAQDDEKRPPFKRRYAWTLLAICAAPWLALLLVGALAS
jgi:hypothetical protein